MPAVLAEAEPRTEGVTPAAALAWTSLGGRGVALRLAAVAPLAVPRLSGGTLRLASVKVWICLLAFVIVI